jgi:predicted nucleic acid-binding protein
VTVAAVLDACVLFPIGLRDVLLDVASELEMYRPLWSPAILDEVERNLVTQKRCTAEQAADLRTALNRVFPDAEVTGYEDRIEEMTNHPKDRHVLAAAVVGEAELVVTSNMKDFPKAACTAAGVRAMNPDDFLLRALELHDGVKDVVRGVADRYGRLGRPCTHDELVSRLFLVTPKFAAQLIAQDDRLRGD